MFIYFFCVNFNFHRQGRTPSNKECKHRTRAQYPINEIVAPIKQRVSNTPCQAFAHRFTFQPPLKQRVSIKRVAMRDTFPKF